MFCKAAGAVALLCFSELLVGIAKFAGLSKKQEAQYLFYSQKDAQTSVVL
jgi:hypothetical protein